MLAGMLLGLGASACWALANVVVQRASLAIGPYRALLWSQLVGVAIVAAVGGVAVAVPGLATGGWLPRLSPAVGVWIVVAGASSLLGYACLFYAFAHGRLTLAVPIASSWAVLSAALALLLFDERLAPGQLAGAAAVIAGAVVVSRHAQKESAGGGAPSGARAGMPPWLLASFGAALGFGVLIPAMGRLTPVFGSIGAIAVIYVADIALGLPLALAFRIGLRPPSRGAWPVVALAGLFETAGFACIALGGRLAPLAIVSPLASLAAALTVAYAWAVMGERPSRGVLVGAALVSAGVLVLAL
jgi:drug/metabolite transporter (DMT)-like permease